MKVDQEAKKALDGLVKEWEKHTTGYKVFWFLDGVGYSVCVSDLRKLMEGMEVEE